MTTSDQHLAVPRYCGACAGLVSATTETADSDCCPHCGAIVQSSTSADVFISYAREDADRAGELAGMLRAAGISHWIDRQRIRLGKSFVAEIASGLVEAKIVVLILSRHAVSSPWVESEIIDAKGRGLPILPVMLEAFELPRPWRLLLALHQWDEAFDQSLATRAEQVIDRIRAELLRVAADPAPATVQLPTPERPPDTPTLLGVEPALSPYVGPRPFSSRMADRFFGRQHEAEALLRLIGRSRTVLVYAASGAGKSSLLNTVITQSLEDRNIDVMLGARVGAALPAHADIDAIRNVFTYSAVYGLDNAAPPHPQVRLADYLKQIRRRPGTRGRVVIFDQFEEIFTQHRERFEDRKAFFEDILQALREEPELRMVFALRQEFLADLDPLADVLPDEFRPQRFVLHRIGPAGALEAITRPAARHAEFAPGVAERLVDELNTIRVRRSDGQVVEKRGEFIEMVHLQIICERLWHTLPRGLTRIEMTHLERAAGEGRTISEFVVHALNAFYDETIDRVVTSDTTRAHGGYSKELIRLGCMKFITPGATRTMVQRANGRTGRLPDWIVEQLENSHLLRAEERGGERWYELSHDRLAEPVSRQVTREVSSLLFAADLLDKVLENTLGERGSLQRYFEPNRDVLAECRPFHVQAGLFPDECEFVFRSSLAAGQDMVEWSRRLASDFPEIRLAVLREAMSSDSVAARRNAAALLGADPLDEVLIDLVALAIADPDPGVRRTAAISIAALDRHDLYRAFAAALDAPETKVGALEALSRIRISADGASPRPGFETFVSAMPASRRRRIRHTAWGLRLREGAPVFPFVVIPAATFAAVTAAAFKWFPGMHNWSLSQATSSAAMGAFHGLTAGIVWSGSIALGLTIYHVVLAREHASRSMLRPFPTMLAGALAGFASSALVVWIVVGVFTTEALRTMGWIASTDLSGSRLWADIFLTRRFGWPYLITGTGLGVGMALVTNAMRASPSWRSLIEEQRSDMASIREAAGATREIMRIVLPHAWALPAAVGIASVLAFAVPELSDGAAGNAPGMVASKATASDLIKGLTFDGLTQVIGAYFGICGMALGLLVMRRGLRVDPRRDHA